MVTRPPASLPPRFDARDPAVAADPYPYYAELRRAGPLARAGPGTWLVPRHADVTALLSDPRLGNELPLAYHEAALGTGPASEFFARVVFYRDPPVHTKLRRLMATAFTPALVHAARGRLRALVDDLLAPGLERGWFEAVEDLASPLSASAIGRLIGVPAADWTVLKEKAIDLGRGFNVAPSEQERQATDSAVLWLQDYVDALLEQRRRAPKDDLLSRMGAAGDGNDGLSRADIVDNAIFALWAGFETALSVIGTAFAALVRFPEQFRRLRESPALVPLVVEEVLRYDAPIQGTARIVRTEVVMGGRRLRPGRILVLLLGSANRDERMFGEPEQFNVDRDPNPHVSFGGGPHRCLGSTLARAEVAVVLEQLTRRCAALEPAGEPVRRITMSWMRFHQHVPVVARPAGRDGSGRTREW